MIHSDSSLFNFFSDFVQLNWDLPPLPRFIVSFDQELSKKLHRLLIEQ